MNEGDILLYVDDIVLLFTSEEKLQQMLSRTLDWWKKWEQDFDKKKPNQNKTKNP